MKPNNQGIPIFCIAPPPQRPICAKINDADLAAKRIDYIESAADNAESVLLLGASIRAAAQSCRRAGVACQGADLFGDVDTRACASTEKIHDYPRQFLEIAQRAPPGPWMYTGGLENYPRLVDKISQSRPLWGVGGRQLRRVRDPLTLHRLLTSADLPTPATLTDKTQLTGDNVWLSKPLGSSGGSGIYEANLGMEVSLARGPRRCYFQARIAGSPVAAVFLGGASSAELLGVTRQIIGESWTGASPYQYTGSIGPLHLDGQCLSQVERLGDVLAKQFELRGLFGVDGILSDGEFYTVEVNPRYTASVEILERARARSMITGHAAKFSSPSNFKVATNTDEPVSPMRGKAIVFSRDDIRIGTAFRQFVSELNRAGESPLIADIPPDGSMIAVGQPIATVFARGISEAEVRAGLIRRTAELRDSMEPISASH